MATTDSVSSCAPHANSHFPPPMAQAPMPIGVIFKSLCPSFRKFILNYSDCEILKEAIQRQCARAAYYNCDRQGNGQQVILEAVTLAIAKPIQEKTVTPVHHHDRRQHGDADSDRRHSAQQAD